MQADEHGAPRLAGKTAIVTGADSKLGIGRATALALAREGANVVVCGISAPYGRAEGWNGIHSVEEELVALGANTLALPTDISSPDSVASLVQRVTQQFGGIDVLVNNAATWPESVVDTSWDISLADWKRQLDVNLTGTFLVCRAAIPSMLSRPFGRIVNVASLAARVPLMRRAGYVASKSALIGLTRVLASDLADRGITVKAICPGAIRTERTAAGQQGGRGGWDNGFSALVPMGRQGSSDEIADVIAFLASSDAADITGQSINIDGGWVMS